MAKKFNRIMLLTLALSPLGVSAAHWGYEGQEAPERWGDLDAAWQTCHQGRNQSPINITHTQPAHLRPLQARYSSGPDSLLNNGHTIQANFSENNNKNTLSLDGETFVLKQFHFHAPSENTIHGKHYPMEMHLVNQDADGEIAVVAVMFEVGNTNPELEKLWHVMPPEADKSSAIETTINLNALLPKQKTYWRFSGSLTTPPCTEGVRWMVLKHPLTLSRTQLELFTKTMRHANNRPVQKLHGRVVIE
ncbi:carbonic anhydrase [Erwinia sp. HR93]|uniref:carbonic anhydrase n=1 Tax=Erwinia sp. HR93 TaxID=3094840 RepID=UPI003A0FD9CC